MGGVSSAESDVDVDRFRGVWYDLAGISSVTYAYSKMTITPVNTLIFEEYDVNHRLRATYNGTATLEPNNKIRMTVSLPRGTVSNTYNVLYVDYDNFALIESEDGLIARILFRYPNISVKQLSVLRKRVEQVGWNYGLIEVEESLIDNSL